MSAFPLTRRAALGALGACLRRRSAFGARWRSPTSGSATSSSTSRRCGPRMGDPTAAWVQQELPGALAQALAGYMRARRPQWRDPGGADRRSLSRAEQRRDRPVGRYAGHHQRYAPGQGPARRGRPPTRPIRAITSYHPMAVDQPLRGRVQSLAGCGFGAGVRGLGAERARALAAKLRQAARRLGSLGAKGPLRRRGGDECRSAP